MRALEIGNWNLFRIIRLIRIILKMLYSLNYQLSFLSFISAFLLVLFFVPLVKRLALKLKIVDIPRLARKIHSRPTPLLGGLAVFLGLALVIAGLTFFSDELVVRTIKFKYIIAILLGAGWLLIGGVLDDKYDLKPRQQIIWPILATITVIAGGIGVKFITNPLGGIIDFNQWQITLFALADMPYRLTILADLFSFFWILGMIYTTKYLDGLDGLVAGNTVIASLVLFFLSLSSAVHQPETALLALVMAGAFLGFLVFNRHPAKIFLGEAGSTLAGFLLAVIAIIAGAKIATTLLIMGIPILDAIWVILRRMFWEKRSPFVGDRKHLHFRLLDAGLTHQQAVLFLYLIAIIFGLIALFLQTQAKAIALLTLLGFMVILGLVVVKKRRNN